MSLVAFGSVRSCGATTLALGVAATWPAERRTLLVEVDPAGGTLAAAAGWPAEPSLVSLAAAARRGGEPTLVWEHCHRLAGGASVLAAPASSEQTRSALGMAGPLLARLGELDADVLVDCGRLDPGSAALGLWERAERAVLVSRPQITDLQALAWWLDGRRLSRGVGVVLVGDGPYPDQEVTDALGVEVLARVPWDPDAAGTLAVVSASDRRLRLAPLVRSARTLADQLTRADATLPPVVEDASIEPGRAAGRRLAFRSRLPRAWRAETRPHANGSVAEEATR